MREETEDIFDRFGKLPELASSAITIGEVIVMEAHICPVRVIGSDVPLFGKSEDALFED